MIGPNPEQAAAGYQKWLHRKAWCEHEEWRQGTLHHDDDTHQQWETCKKCGAGRPGKEVKW